MYLSTFKTYPISLQTNHNNYKNQIKTDYQHKSHIETQNHYYPMKKDHHMVHNQVIIMQY